MPRTARVRAEEKIHHIMSKSIKECDLFPKDIDKEKYISLLKNAKLIFQVEIVAYCLMTNHFHLLIQPRGADISKVMHYLNSKYARYYNKRYERKGHLFTERFKNVPILTEDHLIRATTYIHCNPKDLGYLSLQKLKEYPFSSYREYMMDEKADTLSSPGFIYSFMAKNLRMAKRTYYQFMQLQLKGEEEYIESVLEDNKSEIFHNFVKPKRSIDPSLVLEKLFEIKSSKVKDKLICKYKYHFDDIASLSAIMLRIFSDFRIADIQNSFTGYSEGDICYLCRRGLRLIKDDHMLMKTLAMDL